jgi:hypothetical protein
VDGEAGEGEDEGNKDAWVDAVDDDDDEGEGQDEDGEMTVVDDREGEDGEELLTAVPWRSPHASPVLSVDVGMVLGAPPRV